MGWIDRPILPCPRGRGAEPPSPPVGVRRSWGSQDAHTRDQSPSLVQPQSGCLTVPACTLMVTTFTKLWYVLCTVCHVRYWDGSPGYNLELWDRCAPYLSHLGWPSQCYARDNQPTPPSAVITQPPERGDPPTPSYIAQRLAESLMNYTGRGTSQSHCSRLRWTVQTH